jgi:MFS family permease
VSGRAAEGRTSVWVKGSGARSDTHETVSDDGFRVLPLGQRAGLRLRQEASREQRVLARTATTDSWVLLVSGGCFAIFTLTRFRTLTPDSFMTLIGGRWVSQHGLPSVDHLTVVGQGRRWVDVEWLSQWLFYRFWQLGGYPLVAIAAAALPAISAAILARILFERGAHPRRVVKWTALVLAIAVPDMAVRSQQFAYPLFAGLVWILLRDLERPSARRAAAALAVVVVWANLHGSVLVGAGLVVAYGLWRGLRQPAYFLLAIAAAASPLATPYSLRTIDYYRSVLGNSAIRHFSSEWQPASPASLAALGFFALVLTFAVAVTLGLRHGWRPQWPLLFATVGLIVAGFVAMRWEAWAAFPTVVLACDALNKAQPHSARPVPRWVPVAIPVAAIAGLLLLVIERRTAFEKGSAATAISQVGEYAAAHPRSLVLADDSSSDALLWKQPGLEGRVAFDDRLELFPQHQVDRWGSFIRARDVSLARHYDVVLVTAGNTDLLKRVESLAGWKVRYQGADGIVAVRDSI